MDKQMRKALLYSRKPTDKYRGKMKLENHQCMLKLVAEVLMRIFTVSTLFPNFLSITKIELVMSL